jgi:DNA mismatch repair protein MutH
MKILPPTSENELQHRANLLAGKTLGELALQWGEKVPHTLTHAKGWIGQLVEKALGAYAFNLDQPDFIDLGIELKTLPITSCGQVCGSTYICTAPIPFNDRHWEQSRVWRKIAKILWVPIETDKTKPLFNQRLGVPVFWSPQGYILKHLQEDWEELAELITLGHFDELNAHKGKYLQIRPKAANSKTFIQVVNHTGQTVSIVPKGFYLRTHLTQQIVNQHYHDCT